MSESFRLTCCWRCDAPESKLSRTPRHHHSFLRNADIIRGKNNALRAQKPMMAVRAFFSGAQRNGVFAQRLAVLRRSCYQLGTECESLLSGTQERAENKGRSPRTITECFLCFFLNQVTPHLPFNHLLFTIYYATLQSQFHSLDRALLRHGGRTSGNAQQR